MRVRLTGDENENLQVNSVFTELGDYKSCLYELATRSMRPERVKIHYLAASVSWKLNLASIMLIVVSKSAFIWAWWELEPDCFKSRTNRPYFSSKNISVAVWRTLSNTKICTPWKKRSVSWWCKQTFFYLVYFFEESTEVTVMSAVIQVFQKKEGWRLVSDYGVWEMSNNHFYIGTGECTNVREQCVRTWTGSLWYLKGGNKGRWLQ